MILPVALFYAQTLEAHPNEIRYDMLESITKAADKIMVFYHNGQLKVPVKYHHLMAYWEKGIQAVTMPNYVSSFHPKVWIVRYESDEMPALYRVLITSRNLTFARDWDVAFSTDGKVTDKEQPRNKPLIDFLKYLREKGGGIESEFIEELSTVKFDMPEKFEGFKFLPIGIPNGKGKVYANPLTSGKLMWEELLVVSPFLDSKTLYQLRHSSEKAPYILSTKNELDSLPEEVIGQLDCWQFSRFIEEAEKLSTLAEQEAIGMNQNLHAKLFIGKASDEVSWYLGSANSTDPAQGRNVEFMVQLSGTSVSGIKPRDIFNQLTDSSKSDGIQLFTPYDVAARISMEEQKRIDLEIRKIKYNLSKLKITGSVNKIERGSAYDLIIEIQATRMSWPDNYSIAVKPLPEKTKLPVSITQGCTNTIEEFTGYTETSLSPFLEFNILYKGMLQSDFLLAMEVELPESRLHRIFTSIIDSREKFLKYLAFLLTGEETRIIASPEKKEVGGMGGIESWGFDGLPVFEKLLIAASRSPEKLKSIDTLINRLKAESTSDDKPIVTPEFESLWSVFQNFINVKEK